MHKELITKEVIARKLAMGQLLDIEVQDTGKARFQGPLVGMKEGRYLVTELPSAARHGNLRELLHDDQELIVRTICERTTGECLGFKSFVVSRLNVPDSLLFISFPPSVQIHELRTEKRVLVSEPATVMLDMSMPAIIGTLTDLSASGCRFEFEFTDRYPLKRDDNVEIEFVHPETSRQLRSKATVRSVRNFNNLVSVGMSFDK